MEYKKFVMLVGVLSAMSGARIEAAEFKDVPKKHWAFEEVHWLRADGMLEGWGGKFHGGRQFTRYEMAKVLGRYMGKYEAEKAKVEKQLGELRSEDQQQRARLDDLGGRTSALERRLGIQPPKAMASPTEVARATAVVVPVPTFDPSGSGPGDVTPDMIAGPPPSLVAPLETAPTVPVDEAEAAAVERLAQPETQPAPPALSLSERIALMRQRLEADRQARTAPGGTGSGAEVGSSASASLPGMAPAPAPAPPPVAPASGEVLSDEELAARVRAALGDLDSTPVPEVEAGGSQSAAAPGSLSADQTGRYDAIRDRYMRLMKASGSAPPATAPARAPTLPSMTGASAAGSDFDFQALPGDEEVQPLPGSSAPLPGLDAGSQPLPGLGASSAPLPGMDDDQPLPGIKSSSIDGIEGLDLPEVGMPGLDYIEGTE